MKTYKILIVIPKYIGGNKKNYDYLLFPLGLGYISAVLKKAGYIVTCLNLNHCDGTTKDILKDALDKLDYDFVCTGNNALGYPITETIFNVVKEHKSKPKTVLGGPLITSEPELIFNGLKPDFGIIGEGEEAILELLESLEQDKDLNEVDGLVYWKDGAPRVTRVRSPVANIDDLPFPDLEGLGYEDYLEHQHPNTVYFTSIFSHPRVYYLLGSRSCPFQCTFCYHDNNKYRERSISNIMEELNLNVRKYRINRIYVFDECFAINKERLKAFCGEMTKLRKDIPWELKWMSSLRVDFVTEDILKMMKDAGCDLIGYGFESFSPIVLKSMKKNITPEQIDRIFKATLDAGIAVQGNFIFGDIAETKETAKETLEWWKGNARGQIHMDFIYPYPKSEIYLHCIKKGIIKDKLEFIKNLMVEGSPVLNITNEMTDGEVYQLNKDILKALAKYRKIVKPKSLKKVKDKTYDLEVKCPYCNNLMNYENCHILNKISYSFNVLCKCCPMRFYIGSNSRLFGYKHYDKVNKLRESYGRIIRYLRKIKQ